MRHLAILFFLVASIGSYAGSGLLPLAPPRVTIVCDSKPGAPVAHGLAKLEEALNAKHITFERVDALKDAKTQQVIVAGLTGSGVTGEAGGSGVTAGADGSGQGEAVRLLKAGNRAVPDSAEALTVWKTQYQGRQVWVLAGSDAVGLMYALLDVADRIGWAVNPGQPFSELKEITERPYVSERAVSMYTMNRAYWESRFYDEKYWNKYLDMLARDRFNSLKVIFGYENGGFLAPCYPYFFNVDGFPDVRMVGLSAEQQQKNLAAFNRLIRMAHDRGIRFTVGIWDHIYRGGVQGGGIPGTKDSPDQPVPGLVWGVNGDNLTAYTKAALTKFVKEVPHLDGIEFRMHDESGLKKEEQDGFWRDIFGMMKATVPDLRLDLRVKELKESIIQSALDVGIDFRLDTKYWMEQMGYPYHPTQINPEKSPRRHSYSDLLRYPQRYRMFWVLWNGGTSRVLLNGDPAYARRFAESSHLYDGDGFEVNEPLATKMEAQPHDARPFELLNPGYRYYEYEFERYWHFFQAFGRIGYDPQTPDDTWHKEFAQRFGVKAAPFIEEALHEASWVLPRIITSCYPYSSFPTTRGWAERQRLGDLPSYAKAEGSDLMQFANADEEAQLLIAGGGTPKILPSANSQWLSRVSEEILTLVDAAQKNIGSHSPKEFRSTVTDLKILSGLALYHSRRIAAAVNYRLFERTQDVSALDAAIAGERKAIEAWRGIVTAAGDVYTDDLMMGVRNADLCGHWKDELPALEKGLASLESTRQGLAAGKTASGDGAGAGKAVSDGGAGSGNPSTKAPRYQPATTADNHTLFQLMHVPVATLPAGQAFSLQVKLSAKAGIKSVRLRYRDVNQEEAWQALPMLPGKEKDVYECTVPAGQINSRWDFQYLLEVMDNNNKGAIFPDVNKETPYWIVQLIR